ncbi:MAG: glycosyltransferase [Bacteroidia bacterium]|jgi:spore maturation protein CgeB
MTKARLFIATTYYPQFVTDFYNKNIGMISGSYQHQFDALMRQGFGFGDVWKYELEKTGLFDVEIAVINIPQMQQKWADEQQVGYTSNDWMETILFEQILKFKPDILFAHDRIYLTPVVIRKIKQLQPSIRKVISWDGVAICDKSCFEASDIILTCNQIITDYYIQEDKQSYLLPFAFDHRILTLIPPIEKLYDISFVGSLTLRKNGHLKRFKLLSEVINQFDIDLWLSSFNENKIYFIKQLLQLLRDNDFRGISDVIQLALKNKGEAFGLAMYQILAASKITLNSHIDVSYNISGNSRLWEATGVGACLVTDWKDNMADIFVPDEEVVVYRTPEECVDKVSYLLSHPKDMERIAKAGQKRTLEEYNYASRLEKIIPLLLDI